MTHVLRNKVRVENMDVKKGARKYEDCRLGVTVFVAFCVLFDVFECVRDGIASDTHHR